MSDESTAPAGDTVAIPLPSDAPAEMSVSEAARLLSQARRKPPEPPAESAETATAEEPELAAQAEGDSPQENPAEIETQEDEPADLPLIEPPRSWTKEEKEAFKAWPREAQESIQRVTSTREAEFRRSQNEAAEARKAVEAQMAQAEQVRKDYEAKLPVLAKTIEAALQNEFADIQTFADVRKMQAEDPFRYQQWDLRQKELALVRQEEQAAEQRRSTEMQSNLLKYREEETKKAAEYVPELKDPAKLKDLTDKAVAHLGEFFSNDDLNAFATQGEKPFIFSAGFQRILLNSLKYEQAQKAPPKAIPKPVPPVTRPGTARGGNPSSALQIQNLETQLSKATGQQAIRLAADLTRLKRTVAR